MANHRPTGIIRPAGALVVGISLFHFIGRDFLFAGEVAAFFVLMFLGLAFWSVQKRKAKTRRLAGYAGLGAIVALAFFACFLKNTPKTLPIEAASITHYRVTLSKAVAVKATSVSSVGDLEAVRDSSGKWYSAQGQVAVFLPRSQANDTLHYGQQLLVRGALTPPPPPGNPFQFDYSRYLWLKHIQWQVYVPEGNWMAMGYEPSSYVVALSLQVRQQLVGAFKRYITSARELTIAQALILGVQDDLDASLRNAYSRTGTMHVLAVSGLHVALLYGALLFFLKFFRKGKKSRMVISLLLLGIVWFYAFVTGLSPSVLRSVVMFTILELGQLLDKRATILNTLPATAFLLLCWEPNYLLDVGFQLSFLAVYGIVLLQPLFARIWQPEQKALQYLRDLFTVSVAAQLATFPISLYYFHQFPVYFWLANLLAVPFTSGALYVGVAFMAFFWVPGVGWILGKLLTALLWALNEFLMALEHWPNAVLEGFVITPGQVVALYIAVLAGFLFLLKKQIHWLTLLVLCAAFISGTELAEASRQRKTQELVMYSTRRSSAVGIVQGRKATLLADSAFYAQPQLFGYQVQPHWWARGIREESRFWSDFPKTGQKQEVASYVTEEGNRLMVWQGKRLLWLNHLPKQLPAPLHLDAIVLQHNVWVTVDRLQASFQTNNLVLDQTNSRRYVQQKVGSCGKQDTRYM